MTKEKLEILEKAQEILLDLFYDDTDGFLLLGLYGASVNSLGTIVDHFNTEEDC